MTHAIHLHPSLGLWGNLILPDRPRKLRNRKASMLLGLPVLYQPGAGAGARAGGWQDVKYGALNIGVLRWDVILRPSSWCRFEALSP
jgi:hypothetical protein